MSFKVMMVAAAVIALTAIQGCTPAQVVPISDDFTIDNSKVLIYRESAFNAAGVPMIFGEDEKDYKVLWNDDYTEIQLDKKNHLFFVRSNQADVPFKLPVDLKDGKTKCFKGSANPNNWAKAFFPPAYYMGNTFLLEEVVCPNDAELVGLDRIH